eukprot:scaffold398167_cov16-Prasinocladus_malaysianus.AAC.1
MRINHVYRTRSHKDTRTNTYYDFAFVCRQSAAESFSTSTGTGSRKISITADSYYRIYYGFSKTIATTSEEFSIFTVAKS